MKVKKAEKRVAYFLVANTSSGALFHVSCLALSETSLSIS